jgi:hypothetical protein
MVDVHRIFCDISVSQGGKYEDDSPLIYGAVYHPSSGRPDDGGSSPETSVCFYGTKRRHIPEGCHILFQLFQLRHPLIPYQISEPEVYIIWEIQDQNSI